MALPSEIRFRVTFFDGDGDTAFWGTASNYVVSDPCFETPGPNTNARPYLFVPSTFFQTEVDFLRGASRLGSISFDILDKRETTDDQRTGIVTSKIRDLVGAECLVERYFDDVDQWRAIFRGRVDRYSVDTSAVVKYSFDVTDPRGYEQDDELFAVNNTFSISPFRGPIKDYGAFPAGDGYLLEAVSFGIQNANVSGPDADGIYYAQIGIDEEVARDYSFLGILDVASNTFPGLSVRWQYLTDDPDDPADWRLVTNSPARAGMTSGFLKPADNVVPYNLPSWRAYYASTDSADMPIAGGAIRAQVVAGQTSESTPYFWDNGTLGDLLYEIATGLHTRAVPKEKYDATALAAFRTNSASARFIEKSPQPRRQWVERNIYQAARYAPALTDSLEVSPVPWAAPPTATTTPRLARTSLRPPGEWSHASEDAVNTISGTYIDESIGDQQYTQEYRTKKILGFIPVGVEETSVSQDLSFFERLIELEVNFQVSDADSVAKVGTRVLRYNPITLRTIGSIESRPVGGDTQDPAAVVAANAYIEQAKERYLPRGAPRLTIDARIDDPVVRDAVPGDFLVVECPWHPDYGSSLREAVRYMQLYGFRDSEIGWRTLYLEDAGKRSSEVQDLDNPTNDCVSATTGTLVGPAVDNRSMIYFAEDDDLVFSGCPTDIEIEILAIGGGGGGGTASPGGEAAAGGGGGAGGIKIAKRTISTGTTIPVTVGAAGGAGSAGGDSIVWVDANGNALDPLVDDPNDAIRALGGGAGGQGVDGASANGGSGGSGGGGGARNSGATSGGTALDPFGNNGGGGFGNLGFGTCRDAGGGGGGSYAGAGGGGGNEAGGAGGASTFLRAWGVRLGGGGTGGLQRANSPTAPNGCNQAGSSVVTTPGTAGAAGVGAGGGGAAGDLSATNATQGAVFIRYRGARQALVAPTFTLAEDADDDQRACFTIDSADWPDSSLFILPGYRVRADYAVAALEPAADSGAWLVAGYFSVPGEVCTPKLPTGATVWGRVVAEATDIPPSEPSTAQSVTLTGAAGLLDFYLRESNGVVTAYWTPNAYCGALIFSAAVVAANFSGDADVTLVEEPGQPIDADDLSYVLSKTIVAGQSLRVEVVCYPTLDEVTGNTPLENDEFDRADSGTVGGNWTEFEGGAGSSVSIVSESAVIDSNDNSNPTGIYLAAVSRGEFFAQWGANLVNSGGTGLAVRWHNGVPNGDGYYMSHPGAINRMTSGGFSNIGNFGAFMPEAEEITFQAYVANGVQEFSGTPDGDSFPAESVTAADTTYNGQDGTIGFRGGGIGNDVPIRYARFFPSKYVTISNLPTGWTVEVENVGASVVASAAESSGTATLDLSGIGGCTEPVPSAGFAAVVLKNGGGTEQYRYTTGGIYPGFTATWNVASASFVGVSGDEGRTYIDTIEREASTIPTTDPFAKMILDDDLDPVYDDDLSTLSDDEF